MRHFSIVILLIIILFISDNVVFSALKGGIDYSIPVDYSKMSATEIELNAKKYYSRALSGQDNDVNSDITNALLAYSVLQKLSPENIDYYIKLGRLYEKIGKDRRAKGCFSQAVSIDRKNPQPYFYLGEYYYKRQSYKHALRYYLLAYDKGYSSHYTTLYKMGDIYQKFGDTASSLKYLNKANTLKQNEELTKKIKQVEYLHSLNKVYYN